MELCEILCVFFVVSEFIFTTKDAKLFKPAKKHKAKMNGTLGNNI